MTILALTLVFGFRYEKIYDKARSSPTLGPVKGLNTGPWPSTKSVDHPLTNDNIYIDTKRTQPGDNSLFKAPWRVSQTAIQHFQILKGLTSYLTGHKNNFSPKNALNCRSYKQDHINIFCLQMPLS